MLIAAACAAAYAAAQDDDAAGLRARGAITYVTFCAGCHGANGEGNGAQGAPQLAGRDSAALLRQVSQLEKAARAGAASGHVRPLAQLSGEEIRSIAAYLEILAPTPPAATQ